MPPSRMAVDVLKRWQVQFIQLPTSNECWDAISTIVVIFSIVVPLILAPLGAIDEVTKSLWS
jgi:hypothetical protein